MFLQKQDRQEHQQRGGRQRRMRGIPNHRARGLSPVPEEQDGAVAPREGDQRRLDGRSLSSEAHGRALGGELQQRGPHEESQDHKGPPFAHAVKHLRSEVELQQKRPRSYK